MKLAWPDRENLSETHKDILSDKTLKTFSLKSGKFPSQWNKAKKIRKVVILGEKIKKG